MKFRLFISLICIFFLPGVSSAAAPKSLAGVTLGTNLSEISDKVDMSSALPLYRSEYLAKVSLNRSRDTAAAMWYTATVRTRGALFASR